MRADLALVVFKRDVLVPACGVIFSNALREQLRVIRREVVADDRRLDGIAKLQTSTLVELHHLLEKRAINHVPMVAGFADIGCEHNEGSALESGTVADLARGLERRA